MSTPRDLLTDKIPPQDLPAERAVLGAAILDPAMLAEVVTQLSEWDFFKEAHRRIFGALAELSRDKRVADLITLTDALKRRGALDASGGPATLALLAEEATEAIQTATYVAIVREKAVQREFIRLGADLIDAAYKGHTAGALTETATQRLAGLALRQGAEDRGPWALAQPVAEFLASTEPEVSWLEARLLAPGALTEIFSPRGLGKTHVAYLVAVKLARAGRRVLILDRDNATREVKRRLRASGADCLKTLKVMTRDQVPPLTNRASWERFPFTEWDLVIVDSLDATTEGVGEKDSSKPSQAIAPLLDIAHRTDGPSFLVLGNTIKSGEHGRGSGVVEDRADISYEVRDATGLTPSGTKDWWLELPPAGAGSWAERASRRKRRETYRVAFVPSKFRIGEEPDPFALEIQLATTPWSLTDVTTEIIHAGEAQKEAAEQERARRLDAAADALTAELDARATAGTPLKTEEAVEFLQRACDLKRAGARDLLNTRAGQRWESRPDPNKPGKPRFWYPAEPLRKGLSNAAAAGIPLAKSPRLERGSQEPVSADRMDTGRRQYDPLEPASMARNPDPPSSPPSLPIDSSGDGNAEEI